MRDGFKVIDADRHVLEPSDLFAKYQPGKVSQPGGDQRAKPVLSIGSMVKKFPMPTNCATRPNRKTSALPLPHPSTGAKPLPTPWPPFDPASNLRDMDREGVDVAVLFPTVGLYITWQDDLDPALRAAICRAYNNWLADYRSTATPASRAWP